MVCKLCLNWRHLKCAKLDKRGDYSDWFCSCCVQSIFPFNNIIHDEEFFNTVYFYGNLSVMADIIDSVNSMLYNPFAYDRKRAVLNNNDIDPAVADPGGATGGHAPPPSNDGKIFFSHLVIQITDRFFE